MRISRAARAITLALAVVAIVASIATDAHAQLLWTQLASIGGGNAFELVRSPGGSIFAFSASNVYRSTDDGRTWSISGSGLPRFQYPTLVATRSGTLLLSISINNSYELYRSTDDGATWQPWSNAVVHNFRTTFAPFALDSATGDVYLASWTSVHRSSDDGATWSLVDDATGGGYLHLGSGDLYLLGANGIERLDAETQFRPVPIRAPGTSVISIAVVDSTLFAVAYGSEGMRLFRTRDSGRTWQPSDPQPNTIAALERTSDGALYGFSSGLGTYRSTDAGSTWTRLSEPEGVELFTDFEIAANGDLLAATDDGIIRSIDAGSSWARSSEGFSAQRFRDIAIGPRRQIHAIAQKAGLSGPRTMHVVSTDGGTSWSEATSHGSDVHPGAPFFFDADGVLYAGSATSLHRSIDSARSWTDLGLVDGQHVIGYASLPGRLIVSTTRGLFATRDSGTSWTPMPLPPGEHFGAPAIAFAPDDALLFSLGQTHWRTTDDGLSWHRTGLVADAHFLVAGDDAVYVLAIDGVHRSANGLDGWTHVYRNYIQNGGRTALVASGSRLALQHFDSVYWSSDAGTTWQSDMTGLERQWIAAIGADRYGRFYAATIDGGIFTAGAGFSSVGDDAREAPSSSIALTPIPATGEATIRYATASGGRVRIAIVDARGVEAAVVVDAERGVGSHVERFSVAELAPGAYFVRIRSDRSLAHLPIIVH